MIWFHRNVTFIEDSMNQLTPPAPWQLLRGADISSVPDADGWLFCSAFVEAAGKISQTIVWKQRGAEIVPVTLPRIFSARGQLNWSPAGLRLSVYDTSNDRGDGVTTGWSVPINEFKQFVLTASAIDTVARQNVAYNNSRITALQAAVTPLQAQVATLINQVNDIISRLRNLYQ
jgi:hypothetical protein